MGSMGWDGLLGWLWPRSGSLLRPERPRPVIPRRRGPVVAGSRVRLRIPIASPHTVHIPAGATGIVVGGNPAAKQASVELDTPRTVITVPWRWLEDEPPPSEASAVDPPPSPDPGLRAP